MTIKNKFNGHILIVDDDEKFLDLLADLLEEYIVIKASDGQEAVQKFKENTDVFLIISDYQMPKINGLKLLKEIKKISAKTLFFICTGLGDKDFVINALHAGLDGYFEKPFDSNAVLSKVDTLYQKSKLEFDEEINLMQSFFEDSTLIIEDIEYKLLTINDDSESFQDVKRGLHTIKGSSSFFKYFQQISDFCHRIEDMIKKVTVRTVTLSGKNIDCLISSVDMLKRMLIDLSINYKKEFDLSKYYLELETAEKENNSTTKSESKDTKREVEESPDTATKHEKTSEGIMVKSDKLDSLMELGGELIILRNYLSDYVSDHEKNQQTQGARGLQDIYQQLDNISEEIQTVIMNIRKVKISKILRSYHRVIYDLAKKVNKKVEVKIDLNDVLVDKDVGRYLSEALVHIVRNAVDHGLEDTIEREKAGKDIIGKIEIQVQDTTTSTLIIISDDGRGLNPDAIVAKALEKKIISDDDAKKLSIQDKFQLILLPNFSTAKQLTQVSGRGEGMNIVKNAIERLDGRINIESTVGEGTRFCFEIPYAKSINIIKSLIVKYCDLTFLMPLNEIDRIVTVERNNLCQQNKRNAIINLNDQVYTVLDLAEHLETDEGHMAKDNKSDKVNIILLSSKKRVGLIVDEIIKQIQIVSRDLDVTLQNIDFFKGTTVLPDGGPVLILDVEHILNSL